LLQPEWWFQNEEVKVVAHRNSKLNKPYQRHQKTDMGSQIRVLGVINSYNRKKLNQLDKLLEFLISRRKA